MCREWRIAVEGVIRRIVMVLVIRRSHYSLDQGCSATVPQVLVQATASAGTPLIHQQATTKFRDQTRITNHNTPRKNDLATGTLFASAYRVDGLWSLSTTVSLAHYPEKVHAKET